MLVFVAISINVGYRDFVLNEKIFASLIGQRKMRINDIFTSDIKPSLNWPLIFFFWNKNKNPKVWRLDLCLNSTECFSSITLLCIGLMDLIWLISNWVASLLALTGQRVQFVYKRELSSEVNFLKRLIFFSNRSLGSLYVLKCGVVFRYMLIYNFLMRQKKYKKKLIGP